MGEGLKGTTKAQVHSVFRERLTGLGEDAKKQADSFKQEKQRGWQIPQELTASDVFDVASLHKPAWDREPINSNYTDCMASSKSPGTVGDVVSLKVQLDFNASEERAFRARHSSPIRCMCHAMSRRHFLKEGPTLDAIERLAADAIAAGAG